MGITVIASCLAVMLAAGDVDQGDTAPAATGEGENTVQPAEAANDTAQAATVAPAGSLLNNLIQGTWLHAAGLRWNGYLDQGFTWNPAHPANRYNGPVAANDRANEYLFNEFYLTIARPIDTKRETLDLGFQVDLLYGSDGLFFQSFGLDNRLFPSPQHPHYQLAFSQFYSDFFVPVGKGLTVRAGHFFTVMGYELQLQPDHFFYSYGYLAFYAIPFQHTGVHCYYQATDNLLVSSGINRGWQNFQDNNNALSFMGSLAWTSTSQKTTLSFALITGPEQDEPPKSYSGIVGLPGESLNRWQYTMYWKQQLCPKLDYALFHDYGVQDLSRASPEKNAAWYGVGQIATYKLTDKLAVGLRGEWFRDDDGTRAIGFRTFNTTAPSNFFELTLGLNYRPTSNIIFKPELRWDWQRLDNPLDQGAFNDGRSTRQFLAAVEMVVKF